MIHVGHSMGRFVIDTISDNWGLFLLGYFEVFNTPPIKVKCEDSMHVCYINTTDEIPETEFKELINSQNYYMVFDNNIISIQPGNENIDPKTVIAKCFFSSKISQTIKRTDFTIVDFTTKT